MLMSHRLGVDIPSMIHHACKECGEEWSDIPEGFDRAFLAVGTDLREDVRLWSSIMLPKCSCGGPELDEVAEFPDGNLIKIRSGEAAVKDMTI